MAVRRNGALASARPTASARVDETSVAIGDQSYAEIDELRNRAAFQAFEQAMDIERSFMLRTEGAIRNSIGWRDLPPSQAGLAAALRRAFALPADESARQFESLLQKLG
jgi:hypothetical protein